MSNNSKFPPTTEIKRVIAAAIRAGIEIGSIEIQADKITICPRHPDASAGLSEYDLWKLSHGADTDRVKHGVEKSDAPLTKSRS